MQKTTAEKLTDIFSPMLDENCCITLPEAERLINESEFDISETGIDNLTELLEELSQQFNVDMATEPPTIKCLLAKKEEPTPTESQTLSSKQKNFFKFKIIKSIEFLSTRYPLWKGLIPLSRLGEQLKYVGVEDFGGTSLSEIIKLCPNKLELVTVNDTPCVKLVFNNKGTVTDTPNAKEPTEAQEAGHPLNEAMQQKPAATSELSIAQTRTLSIYKLHDFALFPNYKKALEKLAEMSEPDGWFIMDELNEPDPYHLVDLKLRCNFALAVQRQVSGNADDIHLSLTSAKVDTGFHTKDGHAIIAHFGVNKKRNTENCQSWYFQYFSSEDMMDKQDSL